MTTFTHPSSEFPAPPTLTLEAPDDWGPVVAPGAAMAVAAPEEPGTFRANVVVTVARFGPGHSLDTAGEALGARLGTLPEAEIITATTAELGGVASLVHEVAFVIEGSGTAVQTHRLFLVEHGDRAVDVVHATGTCAAAPDGGAVGTIRGIIESIRAEAG